MTTAKLVQGAIDTNAIEQAQRAVEQELIPRFVAHPGARQGFWMANRSTGSILILTTWSDQAALDAAAAADGAGRTRVAERVGMRIQAVETVQVMAAHHRDPIGARVFRWVRATWVEGLSPTRAGALPARYPAVASDQARSAGYRGSYWLTSPATGDGLALSFWNDEEELWSSAGGSRRRRSELEREFGFRVGRVDHYEGLGVAVAAAADLPATLVPRAS